MRRRGVADPCVLLLVADDLRDIGTRLLRAFEGAQHRCAGRASPNDTHAYHGARRFRRSYKEFSFGASLRCYETKARRTWHIALGPTDIPHTRHFHFHLMVRWAPSRGESALPSVCSIRCKQRTEWVELLPLHHNTITYLQLCRIPEGRATLATRSPARAAPVPHRVCPVLYVRERDPWDLSCG